LALLFLAFALLTGLATLNLYFPSFSGGRRSVLSWIAGLFSGELAPHAVLVQFLMTAGFVLAGAAAGPAGKLALAVMLASWAGQAVAYSRSFQARRALDAALAELKTTEPLRRYPALGEVLQPLPRTPPDVEHLRGIPFSSVDGVNLMLDVFRPREPGPPRPMLLQIHGGAWVVGSRVNQARPLMRHMAERGWICASIDYRLSPRATYPEHLVDCKRAVRFLREQGHEFGGDPGFIIATGGSAGGQLCALLGLTANQPEYQPGFEHVDTSVRACVPFYGVYELVDLEGAYPNAALKTLLEEHVLKTSFESDPEAYHRASPIAQADESAPPFFLIHGDRDSLVPVEVARRFRDALRSKSRNPVLYAELPGAQHAFELLRSPRALYAVEAVAGFCEWVRVRDTAAGPAGPFVTGRG
jgi:acetyl esterase/lipase